MNILTDSRVISRDLFGPEGMPFPERKRVAFRTPASVMTKIFPWTKIYDRSQSWLTEEKVEAVEVGSVDYKTGIVIYKPRLGETSIAFRMFYREKDRMLSKSTTHVPKGYISHAGVESTKTMEGDLDIISNFLKPFSQKWFNLYFGGEQTTIGRSLQLVRRDDAILFYSQECRYLLPTDGIIGVVFQPIVASQDAKGNIVPSKIVHGNFFYVAK
jgi:hypothetical protein